VSVKVVCFDLGGVLVRICTSWPEAMVSAGVFGVLQGGPRLQDCPAFDQYQAGEIGEETYLTRLSEHLGGIGELQAQAVHNGILRESYAGTLRLVMDLESAGVQTGCLSNTNSLHWQEMTETDRFPAIARLQTKAASHVERLSKPDPAFYRLFEARAGVRPEEVLNFDDVAEYVDSARSVGWNAVLVDPMGDTAAQMRAEMVTFGLL